MKKLIFKEENPTITPRELHSTSPIGLQNKTGYRSFLLNTANITHVSNELFIMADTEMMRSDIEKFFKDSEYTLYVFESQYELMRWVYRMDE